jgi:hypothetical protein
MKTNELLEKILPLEAVSLLALARSRKGQGSLEYMMMVAAASIVIVMALAMIVKLKGSMGSGVTIGGSNLSVSSAISSEISTLSKNIS